MKKLYFLLVLSLSFLASAQNPGDVAQNFGKSPGFNNSVQAITTQSDGKILVGGEFTTYNGVTENRIIRLNADGSKDTSFNTGTGFNSAVLAIAVQADGKIIVGGLFGTFNGVAENLIIRLNADGSKDTAFSSGTGFNNTVRAITAQADGKILVGGEFTIYKGVTENRIIRLNADGSKDTSFNTGTEFNNTVYTIATQADGKILVGGFFSTYNGVTENRIIRLNTDGSKDATFVTGTGFNNTVRAIATQADGKILVGGDFTIYKGVTENRIIRLNTDGSKDTSFSTGTGFDNQVNTIAVQADGKIIVGGFFTAYKGPTENRIIRLNTDGSKDTSFTTGTGFNNTVRAIAIQADGKILVGGNFTTYNGVAENYIIRLNTDGSKDTSFSTGTGFNGLVITIAVQADGKILVGGQFTSYKGVPENRIIRLNADGTKDNFFSTGTGFNNQVNAIVAQADGKILVGGNFITYNGATEKYIIRLNTDGSKDTSFNTGTGVNGLVYAIVAQADGKVLIGGAFTAYNGVTENSIIRLNADGSKDTSFNTGTLNGAVRAIAAQTDGKILVGGDFNTYNGATENRIIRLNTDGSKDTSFTTGTGFGFNISFVYAIAIQADAKILVGGFFTSYNGATENCIIRLNTNGSKDASFSTGTGFNEVVNAIATQADGKILVGGAFTAYNGATENRIIRLNTDGSKDTSFSTGTGFNNTVYAIASQADGKILIGGSFATYKGDNSSAYLIALHSETSLGTPSFNDSKALIIYPNPVTDVLHLRVKNFTSIKGVKIIDLQSKLILENTDEIINISHLSNGIYLVKVTTEEGELTKKFIKE
jgi:uncharacterized delta-60 repeat protein